VVARVAVVTAGEDLEAAMAVAVRVVVVREVAETAAVGWAAPRAAGSRIRIRGASRPAERCASW